MNYRIRQYFVDPENFETSDIEAVVTAEGDGLSETEIVRLRINQTTRMDLRPALAMAAAALNILEGAVTVKTRYP